MFSRIIRYYRPKIHFKKGTKTPVKYDEVASLEVAEYHRPEYLDYKKKMTEDEIDLLNQGGRAPSIHWKKIAAITDIH